MTWIETAIGAAMAVGLLAMALIGVLHLLFPRRLTRADIEEPYGDWPRQP